MQGTQRHQHAFTQCQRVFHAVVGASVLYFFFVHLFVWQTFKKHPVSKGYSGFVHRARIVHECAAFESMLHLCTVAFGSGREGGTCWEDQLFLLFSLKWLRYRPEHDVKLLTRRWELCVVVRKVICYLKIGRLCSSHQWTDRRIEGFAREVKYSEFHVTVSDAIELYVDNSRKEVSCVPNSNRKMRTVRKTTSKCKEGEGELKTDTHAAVAHSLRPGTSLPKSTNVAAFATRHSKRRGLKGFESAQVTLQ